MLPLLERLHHEFTSLKVDLLNEIKTLKDELLQKTNVDPSILTETTTQIKSTPEASIIDESNEYSNPHNYRFLSADSHLEAL